MHRLSVERHLLGGKMVMRKNVLKFALLVAMGSIAFGLPADAKIGSVRVFFTKGGLIAGAGIGGGVLTYEGREYPFRVSGLSIGATMGASIARLTGRVSYLDRLSDFEGVYSSAGIGGAVVGGGGRVQLRNDKGVIITLRGIRAGLEFAANLGGVRIAF
jgi:hypothetical protein